MKIIIQGEGGKKEQALTEAERGRNIIGDENHGGSEGC